MILLHICECCPNTSGNTVACVDVKELHEWHVEKCTNHPGFVKVAAGCRNIDNNNEDITELAEDGPEPDPCIAAIMDDTEESKKVHRNHGQKYYAVFRRLTEEEIRTKPPSWYATVFDSSGSISSNATSKTISS